jgi:hypothetical protein
MSGTEGRHPGTQQIARWLVPNPNFQGLAFEITDVIGVLAREMINALPDGPELTTGLRKLVEARDCFVRSAIEADDK